MNISLSQLLLLLLIAILLFGDLKSLSKRFKPSKTDNHKNDRKKGS